MTDSLSAPTTYPLAQRAVLTSIALGCMLVPLNSTMIAILILALVLNVAFALATYFAFCPPWTSCEGWPNMWLWNWANLTTGLLAVIATGVQLGQDRAMEPRFTQVET